MRGADLREAERWLASQAGHREAATREQGEYIARSRHAATRRLYTLIGALGAGLAISVALAVSAFVQRAHPVHQTHIAQSRQLAAETAGDPYLTLASLMALGAYKLSRTIEARSAILSVADSHQLGGAVPAGGGVVKHIAFSRRGDLLASGGTDRAVRLWSTATHQEVGPPLRGSVEKVNSVAFSPRRPILAAASDAGDVHLWNTRTFRSVGTPLISANARTGYPGQAFDVAFSPDGKILAVAFTNSIRLFNVPRHRELRPIAVPNYPVMDVAFSPNGRVLAAGVNDGTVRFWDARTGRQLGGNLRSGCGGVVNGVAFSPDSRTLATACADNSIRLWSVRTRTPLATLTGHTEPVNAVAFSPDGSTLVSGSVDRSVRLWSIATRREIGAPLTGTEGSVYTVAYDPDGTTVASASNDQAIRFWRVASPRQIGAPIGGGDGHVTMAFSPNGSEIAAGYHDGWLRLWNVRTRRQLLTLNEKAGPVDSVAFSPSGNTFAVAYAWGVLGIFNLRTNQVRGGVYDTFAKSWNPVQTRLSFSPSGRFLAVVDENPGDDYQGAVTVYSTSTNQPVGSQFAGSEDVAFSPNERVAAVGGPYEDLTIRLRTLRTGAEHVLRGHTGSVNALAFSHDGKLLASGSADDTLRLWNPATGLPVGGPLTGHSGSINAVTFSPDGTQIATGATDDTIRIWDVASRHELGSPLTGDTAPITSLAFNPSGRILASGSDDGTVRLWSNDPIGTYIARAVRLHPVGIRKRGLAGGRRVRAVPDTGLSQTEMTESGPQPEPSGGDDADRDLELELYKLAVEMADRISARRALANSFFLTVNTGLVALLGGNDLRWYVSLAGIVFSLAWWSTLQSYRQLNAAKFQVINSIEARLPVPLFSSEWEFIQSRRAPKRLWPARSLLAWIRGYHELGTVERIVPLVFAAIYLGDLIAKAVD